MSDNTNSQRDSMPAPNLRDFGILSYALGFHVWLYKTHDEWSLAELNTPAWLGINQDMFRRGDLMYVVTPRSTGIFRLSQGPRGLRLQTLAWITEDDGISIPLRPAE